MAFLGSIPSEVGLRLLLCPLGSNIVTRTACCSVGVALPVYSTFKAIEKKDHKEQEKWLLYWAVYGSFSLVEIYTDRLISWVPLYHHMKFAFLVWLQLPSIEVSLLSSILMDVAYVTDIGFFFGPTECLSELIWTQTGSRHLYEKYLRSFLMKHQVKMDRAVGFIYSEMVKFVNSHQHELDFLKTLLQRSVFAVYNTVRGAIQPVREHHPPAIKDEDSDDDSSAS